MAEPEALYTPTPTVPPARAFPDSNPGGRTLGQTDLDNLHPQFFSTQEMGEWIKRQLGGDVWRLEGQNPTAVSDNIQTALMLLSSRIPRLWFETIPPLVKQYVVRHPAVMGVIRVDFMAPIYATGSYSNAYQWNSNLTGVGVIPQAGPGLILPSGDLSSFLVYRKTFLRVASLAPAYHWDAATHTVYLYNPVNYQACAIITLGRTWKEITSVTHRLWVRNYAKALCAMQLAEIRSKFDGSIPMPGGGALNLGSASLLERAKQDIKDLEAQLYSMQTRVPPLWGD